MKTITIGSGLALVIIGAALAWQIYKPDCVRDGELFCSFASCQRSCHQDNLNSALLDRKPWPLPLDR